MALIVDLTPVELKKLQRKLERERNRLNKRIRSTRKLTKDSDKNPLRRDKFQID